MVRYALTFAMALVIWQAMPAYAGLPMAALQSAPAVNGKPLVVIRFNQRKVYFQQALFTAATKAIETKADVAFVLVSYVPSTGNPASDQQWMNKASVNLREVTQTLIGMGIAPQQIHSGAEYANSITHDEVHVFVK